MHILYTAPRQRLFLTILTLSILSFSGRQLGAAESRWAVLVGINQYQREDITPLNGAVADARAIATVLKQYCDFPSDQVFVLASDDQANRPDLGNILIKLEFVASQAKPGDTFLFYFSGHGITGTPPL